MSVPIVSRAAWGAKPWDNNPKSKGPATVPLSARTEFFVHYDGAHHITRTGHAIPRAIEAQHLKQGWSGVGYNFIIDQAGTIYEGRGWTRQGAHCPGHNVTGLAVQIAVGGDQKPSEAALAACRALYDEACKRAGRTLTKRGHRDGIATLCPGDTLYAWVKAGMPTPDGGGTAPGTPPKPKPKPYGPPKFPSGLAPGRKTPSAKPLQRALKATGFMSRNIPEADTYGPATQAAVARFHQAHPAYRAAGRHYDPAIGPRGWAALHTIAYGKKK
ncbi:N-acetylmuramoyl-L-alanine amidase [Streptomyces microflavus]|uniref:peptidoglycan recognition protein family protein n=1 Tax=Streptomyces microflavus TaxID=1919 RepID=UPI00365D724C